MLDDVSVGGPSPGGTACSPYLQGLPVNPIQHYPRALQKPKKSLSSETLAESQTSDLSGGHWQGTLGKPVPGWSVRLVQGEGLQFNFQFGLCPCSL